MADAGIAYRRAMRAGHTPQELIEATTIGGAHPTAILYRHLAELVASQLEQLLADRS